jgi:hypothetical protein
MKHIGFKHQKENKQNSDIKNYIKIKKQACHKKELPK